MEFQIPDYITIKIEYIIIGIAVFIFYIFYQKVKHDEYERKIEEYKKFEDEIEFVKSKIKLGRYKRDELKKFIN